VCVCVCVCAYLCVREYLFACRCACVPIMQACICVCRYTCASSFMCLCACVVYPLFGLAVLLPAVLIRNRASSTVCALRDAVWLVPCGAGVAVSFYYVASLPATA
jgi:hypothetical protein